MIDVVRDQVIFCSPGSSVATVLVQCICDCNVWCSIAKEIDLWGLHSLGVMIVE